MQNNRFNAIKTANGAIGCTMSHLKCLEDARAKGLSHLLICEDDTLLGSQQGQTRPNVPPTLVNNNTMCAVKNIMYMQAPPLNTEYWGAYTFMLEYIRSAKVEMIEAAQALDLYLSKFTAQIQSNPDDIKDFVKLLEQIEIVSKWFTDKSGDNLTHVFEAFDTTANIGAISPLVGDGTTPNDYTKHYYDNIANVAAKYPGDWLQGILLFEWKNLLKV